MGSSLRERYLRDGFVAPVAVLDQRAASAYRAELERLEALHGPMHYRFKVHTLMRSAYEMAVAPALLDAVGAILGPDILLYNVTWIIKEPGSNAFVSWHQDLTYWGLSSQDQVSAWLALSPATPESGCMQMIPGSHRQGQLPHEKTEDAANVLLNGQTVRGVDASGAVPVPLLPGEASLHHGWTLHTSMPNRSIDRRIGLNIQYLAPTVYQKRGTHDSALLVRGADRFGHFQPDRPAGCDFDLQALALQEELNRRLRGISTGAT